MTYDGYDRQAERNAHTARALHKNAWASLGGSSGIHQITSALQKLPGVSTWSFPVDGAALKPIHTAIKQRIPPRTPIMLTLYIQPYRRGFGFCSSRTYRRPNRDIVTQIRSAPNGIVTEGAYAREESVPMTASPRPYAHMVAHQSNNLRDSGGRWTASMTRSPAAGRRGCLLGVVNLRM